MKLIFKYPVFKTYLQQNSLLSSFSQKISNSFIDQLFEKALEAGAISAKISGAGGGGFMMLFVEPTSKLDVMAALSGFDGSFYRFHFTKEGAQGWSV